MLDIRIHFSNPSALPLNLRCPLNSYYLLWHWKPVSTYIRNTIGSLWRYCSPAVQHATTVLRLPPNIAYKDTNIYPNIFQLFSTCIRSPYRLDIPVYTFIYWYILFLYLNVYIIVSDVALLIRYLWLLLHRDKNGKKSTGTYATWGVYVLQCFNWTVPHKVHYVQTRLLAGFMLTNW